MGKTFGQRVSSCEIFKTCGGFAFNDFISGFDNRRKWRAINGKGIQEYQNIIFYRLDTCRLARSLAG